MKAKVRKEPVKVEVAKTNVGMSFVSKVALTQGYASSGSNTRFNIRGDVYVKN